MVTHRLKVLPAQPLCNQSVAATICSQLLKVVNSMQLPMFISCKEVAVLTIMNASLCSHLHIKSTRVTNS